MWPTDGKAAPRPDAWEVGENPGTNTMADESPANDYRLRNKSPFKARGRERLRHSFLFFCSALDVGCSV